MALTLALSFFYLFYASRSYLYSYISLTHPKDPIDPPPAENTWVTVLLPVYNEPSPILNRLLRACTSFQFGRYDVMVADDSTSPETLRELKEWQSREKIRIVHRAHRDGFKGAALQNAISQLGPRTTHLLIFDADFLPHPSVLTSLPWLQRGRPGMPVVDGPEAFGFRRLTQVENILYFYGFRLPILPLAMLALPWVIRGFALRLGTARIGKILAPWTRTILTGLVIIAQALDLYLLYLILGSISKLGFYSLQVLVFSLAFVSASIASFAGSFLSSVGKRKLGLGLVASPWIVVALTLYSEVMRYSLLCTSV